VQQRLVWSEVLADYTCKPFIALIPVGGLGGKLGQETTPGRAESSKASGAAGMHVFCMAEASAINGVTTTAHGSPVERHGLSGVALIPIIGLSVLFMGGIVRGLRNRKRPTADSESGKAAGRASMQRGESERRHSMAPLQHCSQQRSTTTNGLTF